MSANRAREGHADRKKQRERERICEGRIKERRAMVGNERRKKEAVSRGGRRGRRGRRERGRREGKENGRKKDVGFDVKAERILESSQNEVRPHEPYINQPRLLSLLPFPSFPPLLTCASLKMALFIFALAAPPSLTRPLSCLLCVPSWLAAASLVDREARY